MGIALRTTPLLVIGLALIGCGKEPTANGLGQPRTSADQPRPSADKPRPRADQPRTEATSNLPTVKLWIPGMS
jgi:hypothetical protein